MTRPPNPALIDLEINLKINNSNAINYEKITVVVSHAHVRFSPRLSLIWYKIVKFLGFWLTEFITYGFNSILIFN